MPQAPPTPWTALAPRGSSILVRDNDDGGDDDDVEEHEDDLVMLKDGVASLLEVDGQLDGKDDEQGADCPDQDWLQVRHAGTTGHDASQPFRKKKFLFKFWKMIIQCNGVSYLCFRVSGVLERLSSACQKFWKWTKIFCCNICCFANARFVAFYAFFCSKFLLFLHIFVVCIYFRLLCSNISYLWTKFANTHLTKGILRSPKVWQLLTPWYD